MTAVSITLLRFSDYFEVKLVKMSRLVVRTLSAQTSVFISRAFAAGDKSSYKDTKSGNCERETSERLTGKFCIFKQTILLIGLY